MKVFLFSRLIHFFYHHGDSSVATSPTLHIIPYAAGTLCNDVKVKAFLSSGNFS